MSVVTNVFLFADCYRFSSDDDRGLSPVAEAINALTREHYSGQTFKLINASGDSYGGDKALEIDVLAAAFNHISLRELVEFLRTLPWEPDACVQIVYRDQEDHGMQMLTIVGTPEPFRALC